MIDMLFTKGDLKMMHLIQTSVRDSVLLIVQCYNFLHQLIKSTTFSNIISEAYDSDYPITEVEKKKVDLIKPYMKANIENLIKEKHRVQRLYRLYPYTYGEQYKSIWIKVNKVMEKAKINYL